MFAFAPIIVLFLCGIFQLLLSLVKRNFADFKTKTLSATIVIFFVIHPSIARIYFQAFTCLTVNDKNYLRDDLSTLCFQGAHLV